MATLAELYRRKKDAAGAFPAMPQTPGGGYLPEAGAAPQGFSLSALSQLPAGSIGGSTNGMDYAQMGNKRITLADIGGANDPFAKGSTGTLNVASFGDVPTASLNPDVQRAYADTWRKEQQQQVQRAGMPQGLTLDEFVQKYGQGRDKGALMQLYHQMEGTAVQQGQLARALSQPDPEYLQDKRQAGQMEIERMRQQGQEYRQMSLEDLRQQRQQASIDAADRRQAKYLEAQNERSNTRNSKEDRRFETSLRKEFEGAKIVKEYDTARNQMSRIESGLREIQRDPKNSKNYIALDQSLIMLFNKMLDPDSVVREGEYARTVQNSPIFNRIRGKMEQVMSGGAGFTLEERTALVNMARQFSKEAKGLYDNHANEYRRIAEETGADPGRVVIRRETRGNAPGAPMGESPKFKILAVE